MDKTKPGVHQIGHSTEQVTGLLRLAVETGFDIYQRTVSMESINFD